MGDNVTIIRRISREDIQSFADVSRDSNPVHFENGNEKGIVHGALLNGLVSGVIGTCLPGPGVLVVSQTLNFPNKCFEGELVKITVTLVENRKILKVSFSCYVEESKKTVMYGDARLVLSK